MGKEMRCDWCNDPCEYDTHYILECGDYVCEDCFEAEVDKFIAVYRLQYGEAEGPEFVYRLCRDKALAELPSKG